MTNASTSNPRQRFDRLDTGRNLSPQAGLRLPERVELLRDRLEARADARAAAGLQVDVREARQHVRDWNPAQAVSQHTANRYTLAVERMAATGARPEDAKCKASFEFQRAALVHTVRSEIKQSLTDLDRARRGADVTRAADAYNRVRDGLATLRQYPPTTGCRAADLQRRSAYSGPSRAAPDRSNGKRGSISDLPADWRDRLQRQARDHDKPALAAMSLTGCRPVECQGVKVRQDDDRVTLTIKGAKFDDDRGVKTRTISLEKSELEQSQAGRDLQAWLGGREARTIAVQGSTEAFRERVSRAANRAGMEQVSSYSYRHSAARELKDNGLEKEEIADRLGHRSPHSQSVYG